MIHVDITLPPELQQWIESRISDGAYVDAEDYVRDLLRRDQDAHAAEIGRVKALIEEGLSSGVLDAEPEDILREVVAGIDRKHG
jgi:antitoxin ParD1/3/4